MRELISASSRLRNGFAMGGVLMKSCVLRALRMLRTVALVVSSLITTRALIHSIFCFIYHSRHSSPSTYVSPFSPPPPPPPPSRSAVSPKSQVLAFSASSLCTHTPPALSAHLVCQLSRNANAVVADGNPSTNARPSSESSSLVSIESLVPSPPTQSPSMSFVVRRHRSRAMTTAANASTRAMIARSTNWRRSVTNCVRGCRS